jgi:transposase-like protein
MDAPKTLQQAIQYFSDPDNCVSYMVAQRWPDGVVVCPTCGRKDVTWLATQRKWQCKSKHEKRQFSPKTGTIFEDSPIGLDKWLMALWMIVNCKNGVSSYEIARSIGVTQKSAWFMMHRIRLAMDDSPASGGGKLGGEGKTVQADETFIGGEPKNWHVERRERLRKEVRSKRVQAYNGTYGHKIAVMGMFDKESRQVRAKVVPTVRREVLQKQILDNIEWGSTLHTDEAGSYKSLKDKYVHETVNHAYQYVRGNVSTNSLENFWSLLKRNLKGTYVAVEPFHLDRYLAEQCFRFNTSKTLDDGQRFTKALSQIAGKRLTLAEVTGKVGETRF